MTGRGNEVTNQSPRFILPKNDGTFLLQGASPMGFVLVQGQQYLIPISNELVGSFVHQNPTFSQANFLVNSSPTVLGTVEKTEVSAELQELPPDLDKVGDEQELDENRDATIGFSCEKAFSKEADDFKKSVNADGIVLHQINGFIIEESERPLSPVTIQLKIEKQEERKEVVIPKIEEPPRKEKKKVINTPASRAVVVPVKQSAKLVNLKTSSPQKSIEKPKKRRSELTQLLNMDFGPKAGGRILLKNANEDSRKKRRSLNDRPENDDSEDSKIVKSRRFSDISASRNPSNACSHSNPVTPFPRLRRHSKIKIPNSTNRRSNRNHTNNHSNNPLPCYDDDQSPTSGRSGETDAEEDEEEELLEDEQDDDEMNRKKHPARVLRKRGRNVRKPKSATENSDSLTGQSPKKIYYKPWGTPPYKVINVVNLVCSPGS